MDQLATIDQVTDAVIEAFNARANEVGYTAKVSAWLPVSKDDLKEAPVKGGVSPMPVDQCRGLAMYLIAQHVLIHDPFRGELQLTYEFVGKPFNRTSGCTRLAVRRACSLLEQEVFRSIYEAAMDAIRERGLRLFNTPKRKICA